MKQRITQIARKEGHNEFTKYPIGAESVNITLADGTDLETELQDINENLEWEAIS